MWLSFPAKQPNRFIIQAVISKFRKNISAQKPGAKYTAQFWVIFWGQMISVAGMSLTWPFLTIYMRETLGLSLSVITALISLESFMTILATIIVGPYMDRYGRKPVMVVSLLVNAVSFLVMTQASTLLAFALLMAVRGLFTPLFRVGTNTMVTDLTPEDQRFEAFSLTRTSANIGFAVGPAVGGFIAAASFQLSLTLSGIILGILTVVTMLMLKETLPRDEDPSRPAMQKLPGYAQILKDRTFLTFLIADVFVMIALINMFNLLPVYAKENFGMPESQYGFIMTINAVMAATLQFPVTRITKRKPEFVVLMVGALFYAAGLGSVALGSRFIHFAGSMVIMTCGELILMPTAMSVVARIAPQALRGRYMSLYSLTMGVARGVGPFIGGVLNDQIAPVAIWYGAMLMGLLSAGMFYGMMRRQQQEKMADLQRAA